MASMTAAPRPAPTDILEAAPSNGGVSGEGEALPLGLSETVTLPVALMVGMAMVLLLPVG